MARRSWRVISACEIGTSHQGSGLPCQDSLAHSLIRTRNGPVIACAVCDGAGSAKHSDIGAWLAATTFVELVQVHFESGGKLSDVDRSKVVSWIEATAATLILRAEDDGNHAKDYACTLIAAIIGRDAAVFAQIGDGAVVVSHGEEDGWNWVFWPQHGEYVNQTSFILSTNAAATLEYNFAPRRIDEFAMFSDGIERLVLHSATRTVNDAFFEHMFAAVRGSKSPGLDRQLSEKLKAYLGSPPVNSRTDDDKSLLLATRRPPARASV